MTDDTPVDLHEDDAFPYEERLKLITDVLKHIATLSTGTVLLAGTFMEKVLPTKHYKELFVMAAIALVISVLASVIALYNIVGVATLMGKHRTEKAISEIAHLEGLFASGSLASFCVGIVIMTVYLCLNL